MSMDDFRIWAIKLGCPPEYVPNSDTLKSVFKSRQREIFINLMKRVQPQQDVKIIRENVLIKRLEKFKNQELVVPICNRGFLPKEVQLHLKLEDLKKRKTDVEALLEESRREYEALETYIKRKNIQCISLEHNFTSLEAKVLMLSFKSDSLDAALHKEQQYKDQIATNMPVKLNAKNASDKAAIQAVNKALIELESFYNEYMRDNNARSPTAAKDELWQKLRTVFANIPNFLLFNAILRAKDEQLHDVMQLKQNEQQETQLRTFSSQSVKEPLTPFQLQLMRSKAHLLGLVAQYLAAHHERIETEERFSQAYTPFVNDLQHKVNTFNADASDEDVDEEIISNFIVQYNLRNFSKSQNDYLQQQIEYYKTELERNAKLLENHEVLIGSIRQVYHEIGTSINRIQYETLQLSQVKDKIMYSKNMMSHLLDNFRAHANRASNSMLKTAHLPNKLRAVGPYMSMSTLSVDSFELCNESVLCSTKIDMDSTVSSQHNVSLARSFTTADNVQLDCIRHKLPPHVLELKIFAELTIDDLSCVSNRCAHYLSANALVSKPRELLSTIQLIPGILLTPFGALREIQTRIEWARSVAAHSVDTRLDLEPISISSSFKSRAKEQNEKIAELVDKIQGSNIITQRMLQKVRKVYDFLLENPLRHYIPATKSFNNRNYADYESEFNMYYRMAAKE